MRLIIGLIIMLIGANLAASQPAMADERFIAVWTGAVQGPYPLGNPSAQPDLGFALPNPTMGAVDQSFRLIVRPGQWGTKARIRLSNAFGKQPVTFDAVTLGMQASGAAVVPGTLRTLTFGGQKSVTVPPGQDAVSDQVALGWVRSFADPLMNGRKLAVSFHVVGSSGPITWHAKAMQTSYLSAPHTGAVSQQDAEDGFPYSTTSWYFLDAVQMTAPAEVGAIVAFGDSITDGTASTLNGDDRWPDVFARRLDQATPRRWVVVNEGIGGNQVAGPPDYLTAPISGGPSALSRLRRDAISLPGVRAVIWLEGINDFGGAGASAQTVIDGVRDGVKQLRAGIPGVKIYMATLTSALHSTPTHGTAEVDAKRREFNAFVRTAKIFDGVIEFDAAVLDPATGEMRAPFVPNSTIGGAGDRLHPNRAGYAAMARAIDLSLFGPQAAASPAPVPTKKPPQKTKKTPN